MFNFINSFLQQGSNLNAQEYIKKAKSEPGVLIDVRTKMEYNQGHLKGTDHNFDLTNGQFQRQLTTLDKNETYYLYCRTGNRSGQAARMMKNEGFEKVYNIGGFATLVKAGLEAAR